MSGVAFRCGRHVCMGLVLAGGLVGFVVTRVRADAARPTIPLATATWSATNAKGEVLSTAPGDGFVLAPGEIVRLAARTDEKTDLRRFGFRLQRALDQSSTIEIRLRDDGNSAYLVQVTPGPEFTVSMCAPAVGGGVTPLQRVRVPAPRGDQNAAFDVEVRAFDAWFEVAFDGTALFRVRDERLPRGGASLVADGIRVLRVRTAVCAARAPVDTVLERVDDDLAFVRDGGIGAAGSISRGLGVAATVALGSLAFLLTLVGRVLRRSRMIHAVTTAMVPLAIAWTIAWLLGAALRDGVILATLALGTMLALVGIRDLVNAPPTRSRVRPILAAGVLVACGMSLAVDATSHRNRAEASRADSIARAAATTSTRVEHANSPFVLDAANAYPVPGPYRDCQVRADLVLQPNSVFELRLRGHPRIAEGVALLLSTRPDVASGFVVEARGEWRRVGTIAPSLEPRRPTQLRVRARGDSYEAFVDGQSFAVADDTTFAAGNVVALAAAGRVDLASFGVTPTASEPHAARGELPHLAGCGGIALLLPFAALLAWILRRPWSHVLAPATFAAVPIAVFTDGDALGLFEFVFVSFAVLLVLLIVTALRARGATNARAILAMTSCALIAPLAVASSHAITLEPAADDDPGPELVDGSHLPAGLVHFTSPIVRRFNTYLTDHRFRGRAFPATKPDGTVHVLCLGTSSTWGHGIDESTGLDYPTQVERILRERGLAVEVINAGIRASNSTRARFVFEEHLLPAFDPDIVTASFFLNESTHISQFDEPAFFARAQRPDFENTFLTRHAVRAQIGRGAKRFVELGRRVREDKHDATSVWRELAGDTPSPAERFAQNMRAIVEFGRTHDFDVVLMKEPLRGDPPWLWKPEFHAAIDAIGASANATVVDPTPALRAAGGPSLFLDLVHPNADGHAVVARQVADAIEPLVRARLQQATAR
ncbi:MAG: SGNH/GDSL hydrolase family protein [Planctomycetes bacterium]|nr:SGNH/GDSL hydrolase family protein [Planctomycetota bacterium]MCC7169452.1 SGNH/GDSL hydrolase family protein [Planctomycetota bacterium]